jgi:hypothetical protein
MGKARGDPEHEMVFFSKFYPKPFTIAWGAFPEVHGHIPDSTTGHPDEFPLGIGGTLKMEAPQGTPA